MKKIRAATNRDVPVIKEIVYSVLIEYGLQPDSGSADKDIEDIESYYKNNGGYFGVLEIDGTIAATFGVYKREEHICELRKMYMPAQYRGQGLGKEILEFSLQKARDLGFTTMILETATPLKEAIALYQKYGFTEYQTENLVSRCDMALQLKL